jgi:alpha-1,2-mannosyltransferase
MPNRQPRALGLQQQEPDRRPPTPDRTPSWLPALLAAVVTGYAVLVRPGGLTDLGVYLGAASGLRNGTSLYDFISGNAPFTYPPFAGLLFIPLTWVPLEAMRVAWTLATTGTVLALATLITRNVRRQSPADPTPRSSPVPTTPGAATTPAAACRAPAARQASTGPGTSQADNVLQRWGAAGLALLLVLSAPVSSDLKYGQVSIFLAALVVVDVLGRHRGCGVLIGLAAAIKLTPLIFLPMLFFGGRRREAVTAASTFVACGALAAVVLPGDSWRFWTSEVTHVSRLGYLTSVGNQSLNAALLRMDVAAGVRAAAVLTIGGLVVLLALRRSSRLARDGDWLSAMVIVGAAGIVFSPVSWTHHQVWLVLAVLLPVTRLRRAWPIMVVATMVLPVTALGPPIWSNARLLLAITVAAIVPITRAGKVRFTIVAEVSGFHHDGGNRNADRLA